MGKKINFNDIFIAPIKNFYKDIDENLKSEIEGLILNKITNSKVTFDKQDQLQKEINENRKIINDFYVTNNIRKRKVQNVFLGISFCFIIGFAFYKYYLKNRKVILEYKKINKELSSLNSSKDKQIARYNHISFSSINVFDFLEELLKTKDFSKIELFNNYDFLNYVLEYWDNHSKNNPCLEVKGVQFLVRNNPIYDLILRILEIREVETSNSETFTYSSTETYTDGDGHLKTRTVTKSETLVANHIEMTPFIVEKNLVFFKTNFCKDLVFTTKNSSKDIVKFENEEFSKTYRISDSNNQIELNNLFTINAQENFVNWFKFKSDFFYFEKVPNSFVIYPNESNSDIESLVFLKQLACNMNSFFVIPNQMKSFDEMKAFLINKFSNYLKKITSAIMLPLLSPSISRECYLENHNYLLINNYQEYLKTTDQSSLNSHENNFLQIVNKFNQPLYFSFNRAIAKKPIWFDLVKAKVLNKNNNLTKYSFSLKSYSSKQEVDMVSVVGVHVGLKIIPVKYESFFPIEENKVCYFLPFNSNNNFFRDKIIINKNLDLTDLYYIEDDNTNFLKNNYIWFNNFSYSQNLEDDIFKLKQVSEKFKQIIDSKNLNANIFIDYSGLYLNINEDIGKEIEAYILQILNGIDLKI